MANRIVVPEYIANGGLILPQSLQKDFKEMNLTRKSLQRTASVVPAAAAADQNTPDTVIAINDHFTCSSKLSEKQQQMYSKSLLFIKHAAIGHAKKELGWSDEKIADPDVQNTKEWWNVIAYVVQNHCPWINIDLVVNNSCHNQTHSGEVNMSAIIANVMSLVAGSEAAAQVTALSKTFSDGSGGTDVNSVGTFFWSQKSTNESKSELTLSPAIGDINGNVAYAYAFVYMNHTENNWRSLFVSNHYDSFTCSVVSYRLQILKSEWEDVEDNVNNMIKPWEAAQINSAPMG